MLNTTLVHTNARPSFDSDSNLRHTGLFDELPRIPINELQLVLRFQIHAHVVSEDGQRSVPIDGRKVIQAASITRTVMSLTGLDVDQMESLLEHAEKERLGFGSRFNTVFINNHIGTQQELRPLLHKAARLAPKDSGERMVLCWLLVTGKLHEL